jgi:hypothetical protein
MRAQTKHAAEAARRSAALAFLNAIPCDLETEKTAAQGFAATLKGVSASGTSFENSPLPSWDSVEKTSPHLLNDLAELL